MSNFANGSYKDRQSLFEALQRECVQKVDLKDIPPNNWTTLSTVIIQPPPDSSVVRFQVRALRGNKQFSICPARLFTERTKAVSGVMCSKLGDFVKWNGGEWRLLVSNAGVCESGENGSPGQHLSIGRQRGRHDGDRGGEWYNRGNTMAEPDANDYCT